MAILILDAWKILPFCGNILQCRQVEKGRENYRIFLYSKKSLYGQLEYFLQTFKSSHEGYGYQQSG